MSSYVGNDALMTKYNADQQKYATNIRESDKVILKLIGTAKPKTLLDIGCSTGNLLLHIKRAFPDIALTGGDLAQSSLDIAKANPDLEGVDFRTIDMLDIQGKYDCIVANVVTFGLDWTEYKKAIASVAQALNPGGYYIAFDWIHADRDLTVVETTELAPDGIKLHFRNQDRVASVFRDNGMLLTRLWPFTMPFDLPMPKDPNDLTSHTKMLADGTRLCFRGALYQPWCHLMARKA